MHDDLYQYLTNEDGIAALFPGGIHHMSLPQDVDTWPAMAFQQVSQVAIAEDMEGPEDDELDQSSYQFAVTAADSATVISASRLFHSIFRKFHGTMGATNVQRVSVGNVLQLEERQGDKLRRRVVMDYSIVFDVQ